ncbi:MAG: DNA repair protein RecN [Armatimonadetes bacterium]|nr:DNA repair protein RecN [Armatimonadota bacterium]
MLRELSVQDFAVIEQLRLELDEGFTVLTGETGTGKSIIIGALGAALGERLSGDVIRAGADVARVEAVFDVGDLPRVLAQLEEAGLEAEDGVLIVSRAIGGDRSRYWINGRPVTLSLVQQVTSNLVDLHGQHEHQTLLSETSHLRFLDNFGGPELAAALEKYRALWEELAEARRKLAALQGAERDRAQREDLLRFQVGEIHDAHLEPGEEETLREERSRLQNIEKIRESMAEAHRALSGEEAAGAVDLLGQAAEALTAAGEFDARLAELAEEVEQASIAAAEALRSLDDHAAVLDFEPGRLEEVENRLAEIERLKRKYGDSVEEILEYCQKAEEELAELENSQEAAGELEERIAELRQQAGEAGQALSALREKAARRLEKAALGELAELGMKGASFKVELVRAEDDEGLPGPGGKLLAATADGLEQVRFLFDAAGGDEPRPLSQVASGGELSRLMLCFKTLCARGAEIPTLVFDEIDTGIGGLTAHAVGRKLAELGSRAQVLCVTHLPQIASRADRHLRVESLVRRKRAQVSVTPLEGEERVEELARMLGARRGQEAAREHAEQLLAEAQAERKKAQVKAQ